MNAHAHIKIDSNVRLPGEQRTGRNAIYPFADLEVGQSFFAPGMNTTKMGNAARHHARKTGFQFTSRKWTEDGVEGARVWRVA